MQEQKAENTGRQFCSCFYQLLGIGGSGPTMPGRILGGSCGNVRLFSVPLPLPPFLSLFILFHSCGVLFSPLRRVELLRLAFLFPPFASSATCFSPVRFSSPFFYRFFNLLFILRLPRVPRVIEVTLHGALGYVVCPIFTHGKSTLKRRWSLLPFSLFLFLFLRSFVFVLFLLVLLPLFFLHLVFRFLQFSSYLFSPPPTQVALQ